MIIDVLKDDVTADEKLAGRSVLLVRGYVVSILVSILKSCDTNSMISYNNFAIIVNDTVYRDRYNISYI